MLYTLTEALHDTCRCAQYLTDNRSLATYTCTYQNLKDFNPHMYIKWTIDIYI